MLSKTKFAFFAFCLAFARLTVDAQSCPDCNVLNSSPNITMMEGTGGSTVSRLVFQLSTGGAIRRVHSYYSSVKISSDFDGATESTVYAIPVNNYVINTQVADMDVDGTQDIIVTFASSTGTGGNVRILYGPTFTTHLNVLGTVTSGVPGIPSICRLDASNTALDLIVPNTQSGTMQIWYSTGARTFTAGASLSFTTATYRPGLMAVCGNVDSQGAFSTASDVNEVVFLFQGQGSWALTVLYNFRGVASSPLQRVLVDTSTSSGVFLPRSVRIVKEPNSLYSLICVAVYRQDAGTTQIRRFRFQARVTVTATAAQELSSISVPGDLVTMDSVAYYQQQTTPLPNNNLLMYSYMYYEDPGVFTQYKQMLIIDEPFFNSTSASKKIIADITTTVLSTVIPIYPYFTSASVNGTSPQFSVVAGMKAEGTDFVHIRVCCDDVPDTTTTTTTTTTPDPYPCLTNGCSYDWDSVGNATGPFCSCFHQCETYGSYGCCPDKYETCPLPVHTCADNGCSYRGADQPPEWPPCSCLNDCNQPDGDLCCSDKDHVCPTESPTTTSTSTTTTTTTSTTSTTTTTTTTSTSTSTTTLTTTTTIDSTIICTSCTCVGCGNNVLNATFSSTCSCDYHCATLYQDCCSDFMDECIITTTTTSEPSTSSSCACEYGRCVRGVCVCHIHYSGPTCNIYSNVDLTTSIITTQLLFIGLVAVLVVIYFLGKLGITTSVKQRFSRPRKKNEYT